MYATILAGVKFFNSCAKADNAHLCHNTVRDTVAGLLNMHDVEIKSQIQLIEGKTSSNATSVDNDARLDIKASSLWENPSSEHFSSSLSSSSYPRKDLFEKLARFIQVSRVLNNLNTNNP